MTGQTISHYRIREKLGEGGMGVVYKAEDSKLRRTVALKFLPPHAAENRERFLREAQAAAGLNHPNICTVFEIDEEHGFLAMEFIEGQSLKDKISVRPLPLEEALNIAMQACAGLQAAHEKGVVHRDIKPANLMLTAPGALKIMDFGLAQVGDRTRITKTGASLGTPAYMSPEQAKGEATDRRTDIWSLGAVLYEMVSGRLPFRGENDAALSYAIVHTEPEPLSALRTGMPLELDRIVTKLLAKDPGERYQHVEDLAADLRALSKRPLASIRANQTRPWLWALGGAAVASLIWVALSPKAATPTRERASRFVRLTSDLALSTEPAFSPDGTLLVYASDRAGGGNYDLWLQRVSGGQPIRLTNHPTDDREPDFSPDGSSIAFRSNRDGGGVYVMPALGGDARLIAPQGRNPKFAPDGSRIAYWVGPWLGGPRVSGPSSVFVGPILGGQQTRVAAELTWARNPVWSPDGKQLLVWGRKTAAEDPDWWFVSLDRGPVTAAGVWTVIRKRGLTGDLLPRAWRPDGVLFCAASGTASNVWRLPVSSGTGKIEGSPVQLTSGAGSVDFPSSDRGGRVAFQQADEHYSVFSLPLDSNTGKTIGPAKRIASEFNEYFRGGASDDGRLAVLPKHAGETSEIWIKDLESGMERHLATTPRTPLNPVIARDGSQVAYTAPDQDKQAAYVVPVRGGAVKKICRDCEALGWLKDHRRVLVGTERGLESMDTATGASEIALAGKGLGREVLSWDNRWLALNRNRRIWIAPFHPGSPAPESTWTMVREQSAVDPDRPAGWSPDGRLLYLLLCLDGFRCLYAQRVDPDRGAPAGEPFLVQHFHEPRLQWGSTPYGSAIVNRAFIHDLREATGNIWLLDPSSPVTAKAVDEQ